ncbi:MAG TPA: glycosyltransferase family 4 protein [Candidatus Limnocylindrales bacterium]
MTMHVVITRRYGLAVRDGVNIFIFALADALVSRGHRVSVVATSVGDPAKIGHVFGQCPSIDLISVAGERGRFPVELEGLSVAWLSRGRRTIARLGPDLIVNNGALPFGVGHPSCTVAHDLGWATSARRLGRLRLAYKRFAYARTDRVVAVGTEVRAALGKQLGLQPDSISLIPPCVALGRYGGGGFDGREDAILHSGTSAYKDPGATVRAFAALANPSTRLYVEGAPGPELTRQIMELPASTRRRVELVGELGADHLRRLMATVRVAAFPTRYRIPTASATVVEAIASGTPIVGSGMVSADLLEPGSNGFIARGEAQAAREFGLLLSDPERWAKASGRACLLARRFSADLVADRYLALARGGPEGPGGAAAGA